MHRALGVLEDSPRKPERKTKLKSSTSKSSKSTSSQKPNTPSTKFGKEDGGNNYQSKAQPQKIKVKPRSGNSTSSSIIVAANTSSNSGATAPAVDTGGFASGQYGVLLETKRAEKLCTSLGLRKRHVETLRRAFTREEQLGTGEITTGEFFTMVREKPRQLTKGLFERVGLAREPKQLRFDDFVQCVVTISTWSKSELLHYAFKQFDVDESGVMDGRSGAPSLVRGSQERQ
jgi:hypothetical protein